MSTTLARKFRLDLTTDLTLATGWIQLNGMDDFNPNINMTTEETSAYDTTGWKTSEITMQDWSAAITGFRRQTAGTYDPGQELARIAGMGLFGTAARLGVRWYDKNGGPEAYSGVALADWQRANTGVSNVEKFQLQLTGTDQPLNLNITNPGVAPTVPIILTALPTAQSVTNILTLTGSAFTGTTGITVGGVTVGAKFVVDSDNLISLVVPTGSAGSAPIIVTNAVGASASFAYTRGA